MSMDYNNISMEGDNMMRFVLQKAGAKPLVVLGLNPSTADYNTPDNTIRRIMQLAEHNGFDSFAMFNVYPLRATKPKDLPHDIDYDSHNRNLECIRLTMNKMPKNITILMAFGNNIEIRDYLKFCLGDIIGLLSIYSRSYVHIGALTSKNYPRHPLYCKIEGFRKYTINESIMDVPMSLGISIPNPYEIVREENEIKDNGETICTKVRGYDAKGRIVSIYIEEKKKSGELISYSGVSVSRIGVWYGGGAIKQEGEMLHCTFARTPLQE